MRQCLLLFVLFFSTGCIASESLSAEQQEVWAGEEAYWKFVENQDVDGFMALWDQEFIGWSCGAPAPKNYEELRSGIPGWFADVAAEGEKTTIEPEGVIIDEQFAITYLTAKTTTSNEADGTDVETIKIVHTWRRTDDGWKIIGGMCGSLKR